MDWIKQIPDDELIYVANSVLSRLAEAVREYRTAKSHLQCNQDNEAAKVRFDEARKYFVERRDLYDALSHELRGRGLKD